MSRDPRPRQEWNATSRPSGESSGAKSSLGSVVRRSGMPVASDIRYRSMLPPRSESYSSHLPSPDTLADSMLWVPFVTLVAADPEIGNGPVSASDQMLLSVTRLA